MRIIVTYFLSCITSEIWQIVGPIFTVNRGYLSLMHQLQVNP